MKEKPLVVNWHLLEPCNFSCHYCYAEWSKCKQAPVFRDRSKSEEIIREISSLQACSPYIRLSFAGGEPLLDKDISHKIEFAHSLGIKISVITNGSILSERLSLNTISKLSMIGISIDSFSQTTNKDIGRYSKDREFNYTEIIKILNDYKKLFPNLKIKINTVVNKFNWNEDMSAVILDINPDKWKVLRVLPASPRSKKQTISHKQYEVFKSKHNQIPFAQFEDNEDMQNSYLMIDPYGRLFYNSIGGYKYTESILTNGIDSALKEVEFEYKKFARRYKEGVK